MKSTIFTLLSLFAFVTYSQDFTNRESLDKIPAAPDYTSLKYWIAHPEVQDMADLVPGKKGELKDLQAQAEVDVFFVYPTIYTGDQKPISPWYADVNDRELNQEIAESTIKYQATVFNSTAKIYSPLYRQGHIKVFYSDSTLKNEVLDLAYQDVKKAFEYYMKNWNNDRPIIIASHSQGTVHAARLLHEYFEGKALMDKLVAAYIIGMPVQKNEFRSIPICDSPNETGCWITWNTFLDAYYPPKYELWYSNAASVNPLSWTTDENWANWDENPGGILKNYRKIRPGLTDAKNHRGLLWIHKPKFFGNFLFNWKRFHVADYNLFYLSIRENAALRVSEFLNHKD